MKPAVLFVCVHNSGRSQMAEAFLRRLAGDAFDVHSAGIERGELNPDVVAAMAEIGYDIAHARTKSIADAEIAATGYRFVITVCDQAHAERCPIVPTDGEREHWSFDDPAAITATDPDVRRALVRAIRDGILQRVEAWVAEKRLAAGDALAS